ncbi:MAG: radical SAM protein [Anaerolineales bacterium]|jgi:pyruvate formate lyase activating enzyme
MTTGCVFDIREFTVHDGPGIRTTVFLKGCPLRCAWCHNPEGQSTEPQVMSSPAGTRQVGFEYSPDELAGRLNRQSVLFLPNEGGVTFSGGEPLMQAGFVAEVIDRLEPMPVLLDTSGYGDERDLRLLLDRVDLVYYDLKLIDEGSHLHYTGRSNRPILSNLQVVSRSGVPFVVRVPLVPGVTDTDENLAGIAQAVKGLPGLVQVDLLPYNLAAGAKYRAAGMEFRPEYDESQPVRVNTHVFLEAGEKVRLA